MQGNDRPMKLEKSQVGIAGEYFVAAELSLRGYIASITLRNTRGIDIVASTSDGERSVSIQVKSNSHASTKWILTKKSETFHSPNHYYVFVSFSDLEIKPQYHVVPSAVVAKQIYEGHREWLNGSKNDGSPRKDSDIRNFITSADGPYRDAWDKMFS